MNFTSPPVTRIQEIEPRYIFERISKTYRIERRRNTTTETRGRRTKAPNGRGVDVKKFLRSRYTRRTTIDLRSVERNATEVKAGSQRRCFRVSSCSRGGFKVNGDNGGRKSRKSTRVMLRVYLVKVRKERGEIDRSWKIGGLERRWPMPKEDNFFQVSTTNGASRLVFCLAPLISFHSTRSSLSFARRTNERTNNFASVDVLLEATSIYSDDCTQREKNGSRERRPL